MLGTFLLIKNTISNKTKIFHYLHEHSSMRRRYQKLDNQSDIINKIYKHIVK